MKSFVAPLFAAFLLIVGVFVLAGRWARQTPDPPALETLIVPGLSSALYVVGAGEEDRQQPHPDDEVYYVIRGRADVEVAGRERSVEPGSVIYVQAGARHSFRDVREDLAAVVFRRSP